MMILPKHTANEKKHCVMAAYQTYTVDNKNIFDYINIFGRILSCADDTLTWGSRILSHCGRRKYIMPLYDPGNVRARPNKMNMITYGNSAKKYAALPELCTPLISTSTMTAHANSKHNTRFQLGAPIPSFRFSASASTSLLYESKHNTVVSQDNKKHTHDKIMFAQII